MSSASLSATLGTWSTTAQPRRAHRAIQYGFAWLIILIASIVVPIAVVTAIVAGLLACVTRAAQPITVRSAVLRALILVAAVLTIMIVWSLLLP